MTDNVIPIHKKYRQRMYLDLYVTFPTAIDEDKFNKELEDFREEEVDDIMQKCYEIMKEKYPKVKLRARWYNAFIESISE